MSLYRPRSFATGDMDAIEALFHEHSFATLFTPRAEGEPMVSHLPLIYVPDASEHGTLLGHVARANPHWRVLEAMPSIAVFQGPHAYVSPSWYTEPAEAVPTWNYAVVHVIVRATLLHAEADALEVLDRLVERQEGRRATPWRMDRAAKAITSKIGAIVAFKLAIERIEAKLKLSQNRSAEDRQRVIAALRREGHADADDTAEWMKRFAGED